MKEQKETKTTSICTEKEWYRGKIIDMVRHIDNESILKKIYTIVKTHIAILNEKEGS